ncbi:hypothetical protein ACOSQ4_012782 [Xanthoceras sorbifolium]
MDKSKRVVFLGVQRTKNKPNQRNKKRIFKNVLKYLKYDSYMFAPLINSPSKINSASATGIEMKEPIKGKKKRLLKKAMDYLKSNSYMYGSLFASQPISSPSKVSGPIRYVKRVTTEISTRTLTIEDNQPAIQSANVIAEDQLLEGNLPDTGISNPCTSSHSHREVVKNMLYANCRSSSVSGNGVLDSRPRKLLVD